MPYPSIADSRLDPSSPADESLMQDLADRDAWNWDGATGSGVSPSAAELLAAIGSHNHHGGVGEGEQIDSPGIADNAVNDGGMIASNAVATGKIANTTMGSGNFAAESVTLAKTTGSLCTSAYSGAKAYDTEDDPGADDEVFKGDRVKISHGLGRKAVVVNFKSADYFIRRVDTTHVYLGLRYIEPPASGFGAYDFCLM